MTQLTIGADVSCSDGPCGKVTRLIVEPGSQAVTHVVVDPRHHGQGRLVPVDLVGAAAAEITLRCTRAEFDKLDPAEETESLQTWSGDQVYNPDMAGGPHLVGGFPPSRTLTMVNLRLSVGAQASTKDTIPAGELDVSRGTPVCATDGVIGQIQGLVIDPSSHHVSHILLEEGHLWGRKDVAIPVGVVTKIGDVIRLTISQQEVADLPPVDIRHPAP
jgi:sporulation protein YlmC with PRC-barrel domain